MSLIASHAMLNPYKSKSFYSPLFKTLETQCHVFFWIAIGYFFLNNSYLRPMSFSTWKEVATILLIASGCYLNYFILYPYLFKKSKFYYFITLTSALLIISIAEVLLLLPDVKRIFTTAPRELQETIAPYMWVNTFFRDLAYVGFFMLLRLYRDANKSYHLEVEKEDLKKECQRVELENLKSKAAPEFLFKNLTKIQNKITTEPEKAVEEMTAVTHILHDIIDSTGEELVPLKREIDFISNLILLENDDRFKELYIEFTYPKEGIDDIMVAPLIFEPFIVNAFKFIKPDGTGILTIGIEIKEGNILYFWCINNLVQTIEQPAVVKERVGLQDIQARLKQIYGYKHEVIAVEREMGFTVDLVIDLNQDDIKREMKHLYERW